jgi:hypothetical protein
MIVTGVAVIGVLAIPVKRATLAEWTVRVVDQHGASVPDLPVEQSWSDFDVNERGWRGARTDAAGIVVFPALSRWRPLGYLGILRLIVLLDVHRGDGQAGHVNVPFDPRVSALHPGMGLGDACDDDGCTRAPLDSTLVAKVSERR